MATMATTMTALTTNVSLKSWIHGFCLIITNRHSVASHSKALHCKAKDKCCLEVRKWMPGQVRCTSKQSKHLDTPPTSTSCSAVPPILPRMLLQSVSFVRFSERVVTKRRLLRAPSLCCSRDPLEKQEALASVVAHMSRSCAVLAANS